MRGESAALKERWNREKSAISRVQQLKEEQEQARQEEEKATRAGDWEKAAQLRYGRLARNRERAGSGHQGAGDHQDPARALLKEEIDEEDIARIVAKWTGIPVSRMLEGEIQKLIHMEDRLRRARGRPG